MKAIDGLLLAPAALWLAGAGASVAFKLPLVPLSTLVSVMSAGTLLAHWVLSRRARGRVRDRR